MQYKMNLRRYRQNQSIRDTFATVTLTPKNVIQPYFVYEGLQEKEELPSIVGQYKHNLGSLKKEVAFGLTQGVSSILLFFIPQDKQECNFTYDFDCEVISGIKEEFGDRITIFTDMCLCSQTHTGHCGILEDGEIDNHKSVTELVKKSVAHARAGSDCISPSDMMDDRIKAIRNALDENGFDQTLIMSYSTKFSSNFYGPFRDAAESTPSQGDRKSYQIDYRNEADAMLASIRDMEQGADILMVKPAGAYLDILYRIKNHEVMKDYPLAAYQVSGEYQSLHVMERSNLIDFKSALLESLYAIRRSGADLIITYGANNLKKLLGEV